MAGQRYPIDSNAYETIESELIPLEVNFPLFCGKLQKYGDKK